MSLALAGACRGLNCFRSRYRIYDRAFAVNFWVDSYGFRKESYLISIEVLIAVLIQSLLMLSGVLVECS